MDRGGVSTPGRTLTSAWIRGEWAQFFLCQIGQGSLPRSWAGSYALRGPLWAGLVLGTWEGSQGDQDR